MRSLATILPGEWLDDSVMDFSSGLQIEEQLGPSGVIIVSTMWLALLTRRVPDQAKAIHILRPERLGFDVFSRRFIIIPVHDVRILLLSPKRPESYLSAVEIDRRRASASTDAPRMRVTGEPLAARDRPPCIEDSRLLLLSAHGEPVLGGAIRGMKGPAVRPCDIGGRPMIALIDEVSECPFHAAHTNEASPTPNLHHRI